MSDLTANEAITRMREIAADPNVKAKMQAAWDRVCDALEPFYLAMRPKPRSFEVRHMNEKARERFAHAVAAGRSFDECTKVAIERVKGAV